LALYLRYVSATLTSHIQTSETSVAPNRPMAFTVKAAGKSSHDVAEKFGAHIGAPIPSMAYRKGNLMTRQRPGWSED